MWVPLQKICGDQCVCLTQFSNVYFLSLVPPPCFLNQMYKGHVVAQLDRFVQFSEYNQILLEDESSDKAPAPGLAPKPASKSSEKHPAKSSSKEKPPQLPSTEEQLPEGEV